MPAGADLLLAKPDPNAATVSSTRHSFTVCSVALAPHYRVVTGVTIASATDLFQVVPMPPQRQPVGMRGQSEGRI